VAKVPGPYVLMKARFLSLSKSAISEACALFRSSESNSTVLLPKSCDLSGAAVITTESKVTVVSTCDKRQKGTNTLSRINLLRNIQLSKSRLKEIERRTGNRYDIPNAVAMIIDFYPEAL
jgi:hypothetical protein